MIKETCVVIGCGKSHADLPRTRSSWSDVTTIACNRAIERVPADYWVWVDRLHYERSKWHANAERATHVYPSTWVQRPDGRPGYQFEIARGLPCDESELYLSGGTLTVAAHFALRKGAKRVVFVGCDAWAPGQDRYHAWEGKPMSEADLAAHREHLERTARAIRELGEAYPDTPLLDATPEPRHLGLPPVELGLPQSRGTVARDVSVAMGYGNLVSVTSLGAREAVLWFQDSGGTVRAIRMAVHRSDGLALELKGQSVVERT